MKVEKTFVVKKQYDGENNSETIVEMENVDDSMDFDDFSIELKNNEARMFPVNSRVKLTIEPIE